MLLLSNLHLNNVILISQHLKCIAKRIYMYNGIGVYRYRMMYVIEGTKVKTKNSHEIIII